ncbi:glutamyl-tRNA(Gln) amidotransferase, A subunit [gamma proteobacterium HTCC5015]|nr:glutamyl-tRNA(Gln) amidotransferase, A subunit [gamma proteobacterium HTCC5015]
MHQYSIAEMSQGLERGDFTSVELTQHFLDRIDEHNAEINAFVTVTAELALEQARNADAVRAAGQAGPLTGVPFAHKDIFCTDGVRTSCASKMLDPFVAPYDAAVVERMREAGMVMLGKLNMDEFAMGSSNETSYYGPVKNPWDTERVPGGSSGGSAAAVAARLVPAATGTDTGGSIRQPAAFCNLTGLKPTYGRVSRYGMIAFASSLDQAGPFGRSAEDCAYLLSAMAGHDERDSTCANEPVPDYIGALDQPLKGIKVGLPKEFFGEEMPASIRESVDAAIEVYRAQGAEIVEVSLPNAHLSVPVYYVVAPAECSSNLSRMDGVRFGHRCEDPKDLQDLYTRSRAEGFGDEVKRRIMVGAYALSAGYYDAYYLKAQQLRQLISDDFKKAFEQVDFLLSPTAPETAFKFGEKGDDPVSMYLSDIYTIAVNLAGVPALSMPGQTVDGLPVGIQLIGNYFDEARLLAAAHQFQLATDYHKASPEAFA